MAFLDQYQKELQPIVEKIGMHNSAAMELCTGYFNAHQDEDWVSMARAKLEEILAQKDITAEIAKVQDELNRVRGEIKGYEQSPEAKLRKIKAELADAQKKLQEIKA